MRVEEQEKTKPLVIMQINSVPYLSQPWSPNGHKLESAGNLEMGVIKTLPQNLQPTDKTIW